MSAPKPVVDYYQLLEIERTADHAAINNAVRQQRRRWVSRQNAASLDRQREAEDRLASIAAAERELLNESNRTRYDAQLVAVTAVPGALPAGNQPATDPPAPANRIDWKSRAKQELQQGNLRAAKYSASEATERNPHDHEAWVMRSRVSMASRRIDDAIVELTEVVRLHPTPQFYAQLGNANQTAGYWGDAAVAFLAAGELDPADPSYNLSAARVWLSQGRVDLALPILEPLYATHPHDPDVNLTLAFALAESGRSYLTVLTNGATIFTSEKQIAQARFTVDRAMSLQFDDDGLRTRLSRQLQDADSAAKSVWSFPPKPSGGIAWGRWIGWILLAWIALGLPASAVKTAGLGALLGFVALGAVIWAFFKIYRKPGWQRNLNRNKSFVQQWGI